MDVKTLALKQVVLKAIIDALRDESEQGKRELLDQLIALHESFGAKSMDVSMPDSTKVATVSLKASKPSARITDEQALIEWAKQNAPHVVREVPAHYELSRDALLELVEFTPEGVAITGDGEVVPGLTQTKGGEISHYEIRFVPGARKRILCAWAAGELAKALPDSIPALEEGDNDA